MFKLRRVILDLLLSTFRMSGVYVPAYKSTREITSRFLDVGGHYKPSTQPLY